MTHEQVLILTTAFYLCQIGIFLYGVSRPRDILTAAAQPFVSIIIAARNEAANISTCLSSVLAQSYPTDRFEVIVVDDGSTDGTAEVCKGFTKQFKNLTVMPAKDSQPLRGKTNALLQGIQQSHGEIVLITDADCTVPSSWVEHTLKRYEPHVGIVGGITLQRAINAFEGMQSLDWAYLLGIASAGVRLRNPLSTIGNNLSFRRKAYEEVGGYQKIKFSVTEDYTLFQAIVQTRRWEYLYPLDPQLVVVSKACQSLKDLVRQKHRWGKGGLDMKLSGFTIMAIGFLQHAVIVASLWYGTIAAGAAAFTVKSIGDYAFLYSILSRVHRKHELKYFYAFALYYFIYVLLLPIVVFFGGKVSWKGRSY